MAKNKSGDPPTKKDAEPDPDKIPVETEGDSESAGSQPSVGQPADDHPRFKEVYGKWKESERRSEEMQKDLDAVRTHSRTMISRLEELEQKKVDRPEIPMPNIVDNPDGWEAWHKTEMTGMKKDFLDQIQKSASDSTLQAIMFSEPKYHSIAGLADDEINRGNDSLKQKIYSSESPHRAAFQWGLEQRGESPNGKSGDESVPKPPGGVEGSGDLPPTPPQKSPKLSEAEERVIRQTFFGGERNIPQEKWAEAIKKYRGHQEAMGIKPGGLVV